MLGTDLFHVGHSRGLLISRCKVMVLVSGKRTERLESTEECEIGKQE